MFTQVVYAEVWLANTWFCISETLKIMIWLRSRLYLCFADYLSCKEADLFLHLGGFYNSFLEKVMKGFMIVMWRRVSLYSLCLVGLSMPQESQAPCAQPVCRCPVMRTPLNSVLCQRAVRILFRDMLQQHIGVESLLTNQKEVPPLRSPLSLNMLSAAIDCYCPWGTHAKVFTE